MQSSLWYYIFREMRFTRSGDQAVSHLEKLRHSNEKDQTVLSVVTIKYETIVVLTSGRTKDGLLRYHTHRYDPVGRVWWGDEALWMHSDPIPSSDTMYPFLEYLTGITKQFCPTKDPI